MGRGFIHDYPSSGDVNLFCSTMEFGLKYRYAQSMCYVSEITLSVCVYNLVL